VEAPAAAGTGVTDMGRYAASRAEREHYQAKIARLAYEQRKGLLLPRDQTEKAARDFYGKVKAALQAIPDRIADEIAATSDPAQVRKILAEELDNVMIRTGQVEASYGVQ